MDEQFDFFTDFGGNNESDYHSWALNFDATSEGVEHGIDLKLSGIIDIATELSQSLEGQGGQGGENNYVQEAPADMLNNSAEYLQVFQPTTSYESSNSGSNGAQLNPLKTELTAPTEFLSITPTTSLAPISESKPQLSLQSFQSLQPILPKTQTPQPQSVASTANSAAAAANKDKKRKGSTDITKSIKKTKSVMSTPVPEQPIAPRPATTSKKAQPPTALSVGQPLLRPPGEISYVAVAPTPKLLKPVQNTTTGATPVYTIPAAALANAEEQEKKISKLLDDNANLINVIRENLMNGKMSDNVEPMNRFHKNIYTVLNWLSTMPGIMGDMPPLPVKLSTCFIPARPGAVASSAFGIAGYPGAVTIGTPIAVTNGNQFAQLENGQLVEIVPIHTSPAKMTNASASNAQAVATTLGVKGSTSKSTPIPVKPKPPNILPSPAKQ